MLVSSDRLVPPSPSFEPYRFGSKGAFVRPFTASACRAGGGKMDAVIPWDSRLRLILNTCHNYLKYFPLLALHSCRLQWRSEIFLMKGAQGQKHLEMGYVMRNIKLSINWDMKLEFMGSRRSPSETDVMFGSKPGWGFVGYWLFLCCL